MILTNTILLKKAAEISDIDFNSFILEAVCKEAESVVCDQRIFYLPDKGFMNFDVALDTSYSENPKLKSLLTEIATWNK